MTILWKLSADNLALALLEYHDDLYTWLRANGIDPFDVWADEPLTVEELDGERMIRVRFAAAPGDKVPTTKLVPLRTGIKPLYGATQPGRRFELHRVTEVAGASGERVVADGTQFDEPFRIGLPDGSIVELPAGWCVIRWRGEHSSAAFWERFASAEHVNGHIASTRFVWLDGGAG